MGNQDKTSVMSFLAVPLGTLGAVIGAFLGGYLMVYLIRNGGIFAPPIVGVVTGFMAIGFARRGGLILALIAGLVSLVGSIVAPWMNQVEPKKELADWIHALPTSWIVVMAVSGIIGFCIVMFTPERPSKKPPA